MLCKISVKVASSLPRLISQWQEVPFIFSIQLGACSWDGVSEWKKSGHRVVSSSIWFELIVSPVYYYNESCTHIFCYSIYQLFYLQYFTFLFYHHCLSKGTAMIKINVKKGRGKHQNTGSVIDFFIAAREADLLS